MALRNNIALHLLKFKGDNTLNVSTWLKQFEAHCTMNEIRNPRKLPALLCCQGDTEVSQLIADDELITYEEVIVD